MSTAFSDEMREGGLLLLPIGGESQRTLDVKCYRSVEVSKVKALIKVSLNTPYHVGE
jgi:hypothetical protein